MAELKIKADSGGGTVSLKGPATTTSNAAVQLTLPVDDGTSGQYLKTDGSGALSWSTVSAAEQDASTGDYTLTSGNLVIATNGKGIDFTANTDDESGAGSVSSEVLNDYERGTWTPSITSKGGASYTYQDQEGYYIKVGDLVWISAYIRLSGSSNTGANTVDISGAPFASDNARNALSTGYIYGMTDAESPKICNINSTSIAPMKIHGYDNCLDNELWNNGNERWAFAGCYTTA